MRQFLNLLAIVFTIAIVANVAGLVGAWGLDADKAWGHLWSLLRITAVLFIIFGVLDFDKVEEGTAKAVLRLGGFKKVIMQWKGYKLERGKGKEWNVVPGKDPWSYLGGLRLVGIRFIDKPYKYKFRWRDVVIQKEGEKVRFTEKEIDYIFVRSAVYVVEVMNAETRPPERIPSNVRFLVTMRSVNPQKTLFGGPINGFENALSRLGALLRGWVAGLTYDDILNLKEKSEEIWEGFGVTDSDKKKIRIDGIGKHPLLEKTFKEDWGIEIEKNGIQIADVATTPEYEKALAAEKERKLIAKGFAAKMSGVSTSLIEMIVDVSGINSLPEDERINKIKGIYTKFQENPKQTLDQYPQLVNLIARQMGLDAGAVQQYYIEGGTGLEGLADIFGKALRGGGGPTSKPSNTGDSGKTGNKGKREKTEPRAIEDVIEDELDAEEEGS